MGNGMADFVHATAVAGGTISFDTIADYEDYGRCVGGLSFEGLTRLFSASGREDPWTDTQMELCDSLGLFFQKADIICDYYDDIQGGLYFWPKEIWARPEFGGFSETKDLHEAGGREEEGAMYALSGMSVNALIHATDALDFLLLVKNPGIFHFYAIFATIPMATLELCFMNSELFKKHIILRKVDLARVGCLFPYLRFRNPSHNSLYSCFCARRTSEKFP
jgi:farnesyl-diphosphate farnesyltransferase